MASSDTLSIIWFRRCQTSARSYAQQLRDSTKGAALLYGHFPRSTYQPPFTEDYTCIADTVVERPLLLIERGHDVSDHEANGAEYLGRIPPQCPQVTDFLSVGADSFETA